MIKFNKLEKKIIFFFHLKSGNFIPKLRMPILGPA